MENEFYDIAWINIDKAILHGNCRRGGQETTIEMVLTNDQRDKVYDLNERHARETKELLSSFVGESDDE